MPGILIKDVPDDIHRKLKDRAARHRRSLHREALVILEQVLDDGAGPPSLEEVDRRRVRGNRPLTQELLEEARRTGRP
jgi:plasmid stability protein